MHETLADPLISSFETDTPMPNHMQVIPLSTGRREDEEHGAVQARDCYHENDGLAQGS